MEDRAFGELLSLAGIVTDPRRHNRVRILSEVIALAVCSVLGGAEGWLDVQDFRKAYEGVNASVAAEACAACSKTLLA